MGTNISGLGIANAIGFKPRVDGGRRFLPPNIKSSLVSVISTYGKKNTDSDRDILKDLTGKGNDFKLFNFSFSEASGYGEYKTDFNKNWSLEMSVITGNQIVTFNRGDSKSGIFFLKIPTSLKVNISSFTVDVDFKSSKEDAAPYYYYWDTTGKRNQIRLVKGKNVLPVNYASNSVEGTSGSGFHDSYCDTVTIKQIPDFEHWLVTDGTDDFIESVKPMSEMLEGSDSYTVISIIHQIELNSDHSLGLTNYICYNNPTSRSYIRNTIKENDNTGIYGYKVNPTLFTTINDILGDKNNISINSYGTRSEALNGKFSVVGYRTREGNLSELSKIAYAGTIIANRVLTYDEIYQVIEYYNLDRPGEIIKPSMLYDIRKQGITNINHAEFNDELIDYINGYNIKMYNMLWDKQSGIGNYPISFKDYTYFPARGTVEINRDSFVITSNTSTGNLLEVNTKTKVLPAYKVKIEGTSTIKEGNLKWRITTTAAVTTYIDIFEDGIYDIPAAPQTEEVAYSGWCISKYNETVNVKVTLLAIDDITDAIVLNGIDDFGKVIDVPIWKDYTICALRKWLYTESVDNGIGVGSLVSKSKVGQDGAFIAEQSFLLNPNKTAGYNFGAGNSSLLNDKINEKSFAIQTKYTYGINRQTLSVGSGLDTNTLWFGTVRDNDTRFSYLALWNLMLFPYTMSNFILERQLKKYKLGSLYPDNSFPFRPVVTANSSTKLIQYFDVVTGKSLAVGDYVAKEQQIQLNIMLNDIDEVIKVTIDGKEVPLYSYNDGYYRYRFNIHNSYPKIDITIQEYVRYEDIVQPYPVLLRFKDENNNEISWGDKIKLGSSITRIGSFNDYNLLKDIYTVSNAKLNGNPLTSTSHVVERQMVFTCTATWIFDDNEPNCILSPRLLHAPNSSYKILGHIPDISGHGNHGVIYNSAYKLNSGANGYLVDFTTLRDYGTKGIVRTDSKIYLDESFDYDNGFWLGYTNSPSPTYKVRVFGIPKDGVLSYTGGSWINLINGINELPARTNTKEIHGFFAQTPNVDWSNLVIEQIGEYEGAYCLDGIDDFIAIPTLSKGGKQVLMKVNWSTLNGFIYDQRPASGDKIFGIYTQGDVIAYSQNNNGNTYIDGIINNNIIGSNLSKITHNIVATCDADNSITPSIGKCSYSNSYFAQMSLCDFMLFDEISTDDKIKELNTYIGITPKVTLPNYYWDNYGKKNTDVKRSYIDEQVSLQKTGTSVNPLENFNIGYEAMSGYNGYPVVLGANKTWETSNAVDYIYDINSTIVHITNVKHAANGLLYSYVKREGALANIKEIPAFRVTVKGLEENSKLIYKYLATENATKESIVYLGNGIHKLPKSFVPTDALLDLTTDSWIGFAITPMIEGELVFDCDITIEILPEYENGLVYDGVSDFTDNKNIPIFTDFTAIIKRVDLDAKNNNSTVMFKGNKIYESSIGNGFILDYCYNSKNHVCSYGKLNQIERDDSKIIYLTPESYNGNPIIKGENRDNLGLVLGKYWKGIIYKTILYSKTISLLEINFLKNLMEKDEIIDINHPIFISNTEDKSNASQDT